MEYFEITFPKCLFVYFYEFKNLTHLCSHYHNKDKKYFHHPQKLPKYDSTNDIHGDGYMPLWSQFPQPQLLATTDLISLPMVLPFPRHRNRIMQYVTFSLASFIQQNAFEIHLCCGVSVAHSFPFLSSGLYSLHPIHLSLHQLWAFELFPTGVCLGPFVLLA